MSKHDKSLIEPADITAALGLLSRIPVSASDGNRGAAVAWAFPLVGVILAIIAAALGKIALALGFSAPITAAMVLVTLIMLTGAMHEDGLADSVDGLWGGFDKKRRLEIMKDSRIGTYGVIALVMSLLMRWVALTTLINAGMLFAPLIAAATLSRAPMVALMSYLPNARKKGLSASIGRVEANTVTLAAGFALAISLILVGWVAISAGIAIALITLALAAIAQRKIEGQTGDILGASQQLAEITALAVLSASLA